MLPLRLVEDACQNTRQHPLHLRTPSYGRSGQFRLRHQRRQTAGRITAAGMTKEVTFEPVGGPVNDLVVEPQLIPLGRKGESNGSLSVLQQLWKSATGKGREGVA